MKLLVTGGAGFIGSNFIRYWLKNYPDDKIVNLDALTYAGNLDSLKGLEGNQNYEFVHGNICDAELVNRLVKGIDIIVHFAAESHVDRSIKDSADFIKTNVEGTRVLLEAAKNNGNIRVNSSIQDEVIVISASIMFRPMKSSALSDSMRLNSANRLRMTPALLIAPPRLPPTISSAHITILMACR